MTPNPEASREIGVDGWDDRRVGLRKTKGPAFCGAGKGRIRSSLGWPRRNWIANDDQPDKAQYPKQRGRRHASDAEAGDGSCRGLLHGIIMGIHSGNARKKEDKSD